MMILAKKSDRDTMYIGSSLNDKRSEFRRRHGHRSSLSCRRAALSQSHEWSEIDTVTEPRVVIDSHGHDCAQSHERWQSRCHRATSGRISIRSPIHESSQSHTVRSHGPRATSGGRSARSRTTSGRRSTRSQSHEWCQSCNHRSAMSGRRSVTTQRVLAKPYGHRAT